MTNSFVLYRLPHQKEIQLIECKPKESYSFGFIENLKEEHFIIAPFHIDSKTTAYAFPAKEKRRLSEEELFAHDFNFFEKIQKGIVTTSSNLHQSKAGILRCKMKNGTYQKVVLSRVKKIKRKEKSLPQIFLELCKNYSTAFVYMFQLPNEQIWCGATPETLANYKKGQFKTMALAGTQRLEKRNIEEVIWGHKELDEQKWVQDNLDEKFKKNRISYTKSETYTSQAGHLVHIKTDFNASCSSEKATRLLLDLHPTPAVCGTPTEEAKKEILKTEAHNRLYYSGILGLYAPQNFNVFVNLRCMLVDAKNFYLFVGGGLTKDSDPELEWEETENKAQVLAQIISDDYSI